MNNNSMTKLRLCQKENTNSQIMASNNVTLNDTKKFFDALVP